MFFIYFKGLSVRRFVLAALLILCFPVVAVAQSGDIEQLKRENSELQIKLEETRRLARDSVTRAIQTTDEIVSGLSQRLAAADNVPPETVDNILDLALQIYEQAAKDIESNGLLGEADLLQKLIEVDIKTSIALTKLNLGSFEEAVRNLGEAEERRVAVCVGNKSLDCRIRRMRIAEARGRMALQWRPKTRDRLTQAYQNGEKNGVKVGARAKADAFRVHGDAKPSSVREHDLFLTFWRLQTTQANILRSLATLNDANLAPAQTSTLLGLANERMNACVAALKRPKGANEGNVDDILGIANSSEQRVNPKTTDAENTVRAECLLASSRGKEALAGVDGAVDADTLKKAALADAVAAAREIAGSIQRNPRSLPLRRLAVEAQMQEGLIRADSAEPAARERLVASLKTLTGLVSDKNYQHAALEQTYLEHVERIRKGMGAGSLSGARLDRLDLPEADRVDVLKNGVRIVLERLKRLSGGAKTSSAQDRIQQEKRAERSAGERADLGRTLSANVDPLFAIWVSSQNFADVVTTYSQIRPHLPEITSKTSATDPVFSEVLRLRFRAGQAFRALKREADAIEIFYEIEKIVLQRLNSEDENSQEAPAPLLRYLHAKTVKALGDISVVDINEGRVIDKRLEQALEVVTLAQRRDSANIEFNVALGSVLYNEAVRLVQRGQTDKAAEKLEQARKLGSEKATTRLIAWARNGTGPDARIDRERAERYARESLEKTPLQLDVRGTSTIFPEENRHRVYVDLVRDGIDAVIEREIRRLKRYYGVGSLNETDLAQLRDIYLKARQRVGDGANITSFDMQKASDAVAEEQKATRPYGDSQIAGDLSRADTLIADADYGRALDALNAASRKLSDQIKTPQQVREWGLLGLSYLRLAERNLRSNTGKRDIDLVDKVKTASDRAIVRATDLRLLGVNTSLATRRDLFRTLRDIARRAEVIRQEQRYVASVAPSYETNKSYPLRFNELARSFQALAIAQLADGASVEPYTRDDFEALINARRQMAGLAREGTDIMDESNEALRSAKTRLFTLATRELSSAYALIDELEKSLSETSARLRYQKLKLEIQLEVAEVHQSFDEKQVALRLAREAISDVDSLVEANRDDTALLKIKAEAHELLAVLADSLALKDYLRMIKVIKDLGLDKAPGVEALITEVKKVNSKVPDFIRVLFLSAGKRFDIAREQYGQAVTIRERVLDVDPNAFCPCEVNKNIRQLAQVAQIQEDWNFPIRVGLPPIEAYLEERITRWRKRADDTLNPESTRFAKWYLARALALKDDIARSREDKKSDGGQVASTDRTRYDKADEAFRKISAPSNEMRADHALLISDRAFNHLRRGFDGLLDAEKAIDEAYEIWLELPYSVWVDISQSDLNIPANYAHFKNVRSLIPDEQSRQNRVTAKQIYDKFRDFRLRKDDPATWNNLIEYDLNKLRKVSGYEALRWETRSGDQ